MKPTKPSGLPCPASTTALIIFAKAPVAGRVKTRLIPALGPEGAAALAARLLAHTVSMAMDAGFDYVEICATPETGHSAFQQLAAQFSLTLTTQGEGDLGERMHRALERTLRAHRRVLLVGTDAPSLDSARLRQAAAALNTCEAVFVPALDGGYALVGLTRACPTLFSNLPWSTPQVMQTTRQRAAMAQMTWSELEPVADIDEPPDLVHLPAGWTV